MLYLAIFSLLTLSKLFTLPIICYEILFYILFISEIDLILVILANLETWLTNGHCYSQRVKRLNLESNDHQHSEN